MSVLQKNLSQLKVETVEIELDAPVSKRNSKLETLASYSVRNFVYLPQRPQADTCTCKKHVKIG